MNKAKKSDIALSAAEIKRFERHITLPEVGIDGQKKLKAASVICIGIGGLGSPILMYLAAAGVGRIGVVDFDVIEASNLQRQVIHTSQDIGKTKTSSAKRRILEINPNCKVDIFDTKITKENALEIIKPFDIVCDGSDNFATRYLINDACLILNKPNIYGSILKYEGQATVFNLSSKSPNYRDLLPEAPPNHLIPSCATGGVLGVLPGIIGLIQATEAIKIITGIGESLDGRLLVFNALTMKFREIKLQKDKNRREIKKLVDGKNLHNIENDDYSFFNVRSISTKELKVILDTNKNNIDLIDVRNKEEVKLSSIPGSRSIPLEYIENGEAIDQIKQIALNHKLYIHCKSGVRAEKAIRILKSYGIESINIAGGIDAWKYETIKQIPQDTNL